MKEAVNMRKNDILILLGIAFWFLSIILFGLSYNERGGCEVTRLDESSSTIDCGNGNSANINYINRCLFVSSISFISGLGCFLRNAMINDANQKKAKK